MAADTFSSELGILSKSKPRLLTSWNLREVPPGTNGGVTLAGTLAGFGGAAIIALTTLTLLPFCAEPHITSQKVAGRLPGFRGGIGWTWQEKGLFVLVIVLWGGLGSLLDSALGGWFQASVVDSRTGKVIEGRGGKNVRVLSLLYETDILRYYRCLLLGLGRRTTRRAMRRVDGSRVDWGFLITMLSIVSWHLS